MAYAHDDIRLPFWLHSSEVSSTALLVWGYLDMRQGRKSTCWPSVARMAADLHKNRKRVMRAIAELETAGLVEVQRRKGAGNRYSVTRTATAKPVQEADGSPGGTGPRDGPQPVPETDGTGPRDGRDRSQSGTRNPSNNPTKNSSSEPAAGAREADPVSLEDRARWLRKALAVRYEQAFAMPLPSGKLTDRQSAQVTDWVLAVAQRKGETFAAVGTRVLDGWCADEWVRTQRFPTRHLVQYLDRFESGEGWSQGQRRSGIAKAQPPEAFGAGTPLSIWDGEARV